MQTKQWRWERGKTRLEDAPCRPRTPAREGGVGVGGWGCLPTGSPPDTPSASPIPITLRWGQNPVACSENPPAYHDPTPSSFQGKERG